MAWALLRYLMAHHTIRTSRLDSRYITRQESGVLCGSIKYHRPAFQGNPILLSAAIEKEGTEWEAIEVRAEARDSEGNLLVEGSFKVIPVSPEKFKVMTGINELPEGWASWLGDSGI